MDSFYLMGGIGFLVFGFILCSMLVGVYDHREEYLRGKVISAIIALVCFFMSIGLVSFATMHDACECQEPASVVEAS